MADNSMNKAILESGIQSLEMKYQPIYSTFNNAVIAYRTKTTVYSLNLGTITEEDYRYAIDTGNKTGIRLSEWNIQEAISSINALKEAGKEFEFIAAKCTSSFADQKDVFSRIKMILNREPLDDPSKLCIEFPKTLLYKTSDTAEKTILDLKLMGVRTMVSECGARDLPIARFMDLPVDFVLLDSKTVSLINDRNKSEVVPKFCQYLKSMGLAIYAESIPNDEILYELRRMDCLGGTLSDHYQGGLHFTENEFTLNDILNQEEISEDE